MVAELLEALRHHLPKPYVACRPIAVADTDIGADSLGAVRVLGISRGHAVEAEVKYETVPRLRVRQDPRELGVVGLIVAFDPLRDLLDAEFPGIQGNVSRAHCVYEACTVLQGLIGWAERLRPSSLDECGVHIIGGAVGVDVRNWELRA